MDHELRFTPMLLTARRLLREGVIGPVRAASHVCSVSDSGTCICSSQLAGAKRHVTFESTMMNASFPLVCTSP